MKDTKIKYTKGSDNIYSDLGFSDAKERLDKAKLAMRINQIIDKNKFSQNEAAKILKINQPKISALMNGHLSGFSMERLIYFLNLLDQDVDIVIKSKPIRRKSHGKIHIVCKNDIRAAS